MKHIIAILALGALASLAAVTPGGSLQPTTPPSGASFNDPVPPPLTPPVPLRWTVETSRAQVAQFEAYRGETLAIEAALNSYGKPLEGVLQPTLYWQTNGMGAAWWTATATASGNVLRATWSPTNDCGATAYNCFIGGPESTYRAAFRLRMLPSPGYTPNHLPLPTVKAESDPVFSAWLATNEFSSAGVDTNAVLGLIAAATNAITPQSIGALPTVGGGHISGFHYNGDGWESENPAIIELDGTEQGGGRVVISSGAMGEGASIYINDKSVSTDERVDSVSETATGAFNLASQAYYASGLLADTVSAWQTYWDGDDVRVTVTNYYGSKDIPSLYLEQKMPADESNDAPWFKIVWDERTRWNAFLPGYAVLTNHVHQNLADRAWGVYDSATGGYSPDGLLQLSQEQILIGGGMAYQKTVTSGGSAYWVLTANGPTTLSGQTETGYFRIQDADGNALFEIVKGDKRIVGATATAIKATGNGVTIHYNSVSSEPPALEWCDDLRTADWQPVTARSGGGASFGWSPPPDQPMASWSGESGAWVADVTFGEAPRAAFFKATFEAGGNTYIRNNVASTLDKVVVGGIEYTVTVETVNGKKLLVLR